MSLFKTWTGQSQKSQKSHQSNQADEQLLRPMARPQPQRYPSKTELHQVATNRSNGDPFAGHLNHLTEHQERQLEKFKSTLHDHHLYRPGALEQPASHDDQTLLRYLRARKFDIRGAFAQFSDTEKWSQENKITELYEQFDVEFYEKARRLYPQWTGHRDKRGIPVYVYVVKGVDSKNVSTYSKEAAVYKAKLPHHSSLSTPAKMLPLFALYENLLRFTIPLCSSLENRQHPEVPVTNSNNIVDISGVGFKQFWNLKDHMQESSVLATSHYPETLDRIFIIGAPSFFPTVWSWIKRWFDPVTVSKIFILSHHEVKTRLSEFIDPDDFPKKYGGNLDWEPGMPPNLDATMTAALERDGSKGWIEGPCLWEQNQRIPVGTVKGKPRRPVRVEPIPVRAGGEGYDISQSLLTADQAAPAQIVAPVPGSASASTPSPITAQPLPTEADPAPSMAHSGSTASASLNMPTTPPESATSIHTAATVPTMEGPARVLDSDALIVANGSVLHPDDTKPSMERFVTAVEDLHTLRAQANGVPA